MPHAVAGDEHVSIGADFIDDLVRTVDPILGRQLLVDPDEISLIDALKAPIRLCAPVEPAG